MRTTYPDALVGSVDLKDLIGFRLHEIVKCKTCGHGTSRTYLYDDNIPLKKRRQNIVLYENAFRQRFFYTRESFIASLCISLLC